MKFLSIVLNKALPGFIVIAAAERSPAAAIATRITVSLASPTSVRYRGTGESPAVRIVSFGWRT